MSAQAQAPLLSTKLHAPDPRERIGREALVARLSDAPDAKLALIRAPAGWGKSTLLSQWRSAEHERREFAWVTLDSSDSDPIRFWTYALQALRTLSRELGTRSLALLRAPGVDLVGEMIPVLIGEFEAFGRPLVLALDDYHQLEGDAIHAGMRRLLDYLPGRVCVAIATRTEPPLQVSRLRARGQLVEIDADELRFSLAETAVLLNEFLGLGLADEDVAALHQRAEGWPAAVYLAGLSLRNRADRHDFIARFAGDDRHIVDYLGEEVLADLDPDTRELLLRTSILEQMNGPLCDAIADTSGSARKLGTLARSNLFVVPLDDRRDWYRYHHLFRACLNAELRIESAELIPELHRRASRWFQRTGEMTEAINHAIAGEDFPTASELMAAHWNDAVSTGGLRTVEMWLMALPEHVVTGDARLCLARAWTSFAKGALEEVLPCLETAEAAPAPGPLLDGTTSVASGAATLRASYWLRMGDFGRTVSYAREALALEQGPWRAISANCLGTAFYWLDEPAQARQQLEATIEVGGELVPLVALFAAGLLALLDCERQDWNAVSRRLNEARQMIEAGGLDEYWMTAGATLAGGLALENHGDLAAAEMAMARSLVLYRRGQAPVEIANALLHLARLHVRQGHAAVASDEVGEAAMLVRSCPDPGPRIQRMLSQARGQARTAARGTPRPPRVEELSEGEFRVLRLLASDLTQREIGAELYLSLNTIKSHTRSIFRKLGASSRDQAVARARELELI
ncbi:MAG TPA: LuxR C-terminal-related transcriptional regulator [Solirubrobacteraceae bacterium]|nr:LuxR C-terminal-related transcriptional regulator [Solirubrobacteraceae bacterium]